MKSGSWRTWLGVPLAAIGWLAVAKTTVDFIRIFQFGGLEKYAGAVSLGFMLWDGLIAAIFSLAAWLLWRKSLERRRLNAVGAIVIATAVSFGVVGALVSYEKPILPLRIPGP